jgi:hypothetical protein
VTVSCGVRGLLHAGIHREDIDQACDLQDPAHRLLRGRQGQVTAASPSPFQYSQQHRQTGVADALKVRQVHDDPLSGVVDRLPGQAALILLPPEHAVSPGVSSPVVRNENLELITGEGKRRARLYR